jgi:hypothetical protein
MTRSPRSPMWSITEHHDREPSLDHLARASDPFRRHD